MGNQTKLILILLLGLGLRLINLGQSFWLDEASQAQLSSISPLGIWRGRGGDFHPPLFYFLAHTWLQFGRSETWLRLLPVTFGVLNILVIYLLAQRLFSRGHLAAFFLAIAPFHIYYSQEFRSYSLLALLGTLSMYYLFCKKYWWLAVTNTLLLYTHYSSVFLILTQILISPVTIYYLPLTLALWAPWLPQFLTQLQSGVNIDAYLPGWRSVLSIAPLKAFPTIIFKLVAGRITFLNRYLYGLYILFTFAVTFAALVVAKNKHKSLLVTWAFVPPLALILTSLALPQNQPFRVIYAVPALVLLFTLACQRFPRLFFTLLVYISLVGNVAYFTRPRLQREQWRQLATFLNRHPATTVIKFQAPFAPLVWYAPNVPIVPAVPSYPANPTQVTRILSESFIPAPPKIYLLEYLSDLTDPDRLVDREIKNLGYTPGSIHNFEGVGFVEEYRRSP